MTTKHRLTAIARRLSAATGVDVRPNAYDVGYWAAHNDEDCPLKDAKAKEGFEDYKKEIEAEQARVLRPHCEQCEVLVINGHACHETGCQNSWIDPVYQTGYPVACFECGCDFVPTERNHRLCDDCANPPPYEEETDAEDSSD